jgi:hypothetical protein
MSGFALAAAACCEVKTLGCGICVPWQELQNASLWQLEQRASACVATDEWTSTKSGACGTPGP